MLILPCQRVVLHNTECQDTPDTTENTRSSLLHCAERTVFIKIKNCDVVIIDNTSRLNRVKNEIVKFHRIKLVIIDVQICDAVINALFQLLGVDIRNFISLFFPWNHNTVQDILVNPFAAQLSRYQTGVSINRSRAMAGSFQFTIAQSIYVKFFRQVLQHGHRQKLIWISIKPTVLSCKNRHSNTVVFIRFILLAQGVR